MSTEIRSMGVDTKNVVYEGVQQNQALAPEFQIHDMIGHSISSPRQEIAESGPIKIYIDERLLVGQSLQPHFTGERSRTLAERVGEAYKYDLEPEETDFLNRAAGQFGRRLSSQE